MRAELLDPRTDGRWSEFVARAPGATIFHHPLWHRLLAAHYGYEFNACCLTDEASRVVAGLPWARVESRLTGRRLVALPFSDACEPLTDGAGPGELAAAVETARREQGLGLEVRWRFDGLGGAAPHLYWRHVLALEADPDAVERRARDGIRRGAEKARREGLTFERGTDTAALDVFYDMHARTRRRQGVPVQPKRFIRDLAGLFAAGLGFVALVRARGGTAVAGAVFLRAGAHLTYKYGASDRAALAMRPNNLLFQDVIRWACEEGFRELDFGRTDLDHDGLRQFKLGWGTEESPLHYTYAGLDVPRAASISKRALAKVIRHSPTALARLTGRALYRHFG
jgi:CelD/BcsL family acetyltransferase involved in cellulose biosynthesis